MQTKPRGASRIGTLETLIADHQRAYGLAVTAPVARRIVGLGKTAFNVAVAEGRLRSIGRRGGTRNGRRVFATADLVTFLLGASAAPGGGR